MLRHLRKEKKVVGNYIQHLLENPKRLLVTILIGSTIANVLASIISVMIALQLAPVVGVSGELAIFIQIVLLTILILLFGETAPKLWAQKYPVQSAGILALPLYWITIILYPISTVIAELLKLFTGKIKLDKSKYVLQDSDIKDLADLSIEKGTIESEEHELIHGIVSFGTVTAREIMTPRVDIKAVSVQENIDDLLAIINESGHSRIPLYEENLDKIIGIIYAKDLLPYLKEPEKKKSLILKNIAHEPFIVPETKLVNILLHEFQDRNTHLGIVVDEYGGTSGLISLEDILEEIVGEIRDEYDKDENEITKVDENNYLILGKVSIDELNELLGHNFSSDNDDYDTVGGFILSYAGTIPRQGFHFAINNYKFTVKEVVNKRINKILVEKIDRQ